MHQYKTLSPLINVRSRFFKIFKKKVPTAEDEDIEMKMKKTAVTLRTILSLR